MAFMPIPASVYCGLLPVVQSLFPCPLLIGYGIDRYPMTQIRVFAGLVVAALVVMPLPASAWNIPGHTLSAAITYQALQQEDPHLVRNGQKLNCIL
jgi:hypothetical protein